MSAHIRGAAIYRALCRTNGGAKFRDEADRGHRRLKIYIPQVSFVAVDFNRSEGHATDRSVLASSPARDGRVRYTFWAFAVRGLMPTHERSTSPSLSRPLDGMKADEAPALHLFLAPQRNLFRAQQSHFHTFHTIQYRPAPVAILPSAVTSVSSSVSIEPRCLGLAKGNAPGPKRGCSGPLDFEIGCDVALKAACLNFQHGDWGVIFTILRTFLNFQLCHFATWGGFVYGQYLGCEARWQPREVVLCACATTW
jgi:hypothetical protein